MMSSATQKKKRRQIALIGLAAFFILPSCSTLEPETAGQGFLPDDPQHVSQDTSEPRPSESEKPKESPEQPEPSQKNEPSPDSPKPESPDEPQESKPERNCDEIAWSKNLREGDIVIPGETTGYADEDEDGEVEAQERSVGMCKLHESGKKCGLVLFAAKSCAICPSEFQKIGAQMERIKTADMAIFVSFTETSLDEALEIVSGADFLGSKHIQFLSNQDPLALTIAPRKLLLDLRTMKVEALDLPLVRYHTIESMIDRCNNL